MVLISILIFILGLFFLIKSSDFFIIYSSKIAKRLGVSEFFIGLTLVAIGTSIPEMASSIIGAIKGSSTVAMGSIIGSNITNITLVIGIAATTTILKTCQKTYRRDGKILLASSILVFIMAIFKTINLFFGIILLFIYIGYISFVFKTRKNKIHKNQLREFLDHLLHLGYIPKFSNFKERIKHRPFENKINLFKEFSVATISIFFIIISAQGLVRGAIDIAHFLKVPSSIIGMTVIAFGTSVPEISVTLTAAKKGFSELMIGNIIGSNISNLLLVLGLTSIIHPIKITNLTLFFAMPIMIIVTAVFLRFSKRNWHINKFEGISLVALYLDFLLWILIFNSI